MDLHKKSSLIHRQRSLCKKVNFSSCTLLVLMSLTLWFVQTRCHCYHEQPHIQQRVTEGQRSSSLFNSRESKEDLKPATGLYVYCRHWMHLKHFLKFLFLSFGSDDYQVTVSVVMLIFCRTKRIMLFVSLTTYLWFFLFFWKYRSWYIYFNGIKLSQSS